IKNAYDAVSEKGMGKIHLIVSDSEEFIIFDIEDNGVGISEEKIKHIFDEFYTTKQSGSGIGLSIVKHILELYNAEISVKSKLNVGTIFTVKIPVYDEKD
ncbi:MAG: ATP-binding protein, partial [Deferribacterota bacterium]|nr:ATP-binding protein [Deferribacterota bacterium]